MNDDKSLIRRQIEYYRARAAEYDEWFLRTGRYDRGEEHRRQWFAEVERLREALDAERPRGDILELACGTGIWTTHLARQARRIVAVDVSPEAIEINRQRITNHPVEYMQADLFAWRPSERYDFVFFAFWLSHVPPSHFGHFWSSARDALRPDGKVFFIDSLPIQDSTARNHGPLDRDGRATRRLNNGREYEIIKIYYDPPELEQRLKDLGWNGYVQTTGHFFLYGCFSRIFNQ